jgi:hypothetical protein
MPAKSSRFIWIVRRSGTEVVQLDGACTKSYSVALKLCKQYQLIGICGVSLWYARDFHRLIHTCVENLTQEKYSSRGSASVVLHMEEKILGAEKPELIMLHEILSHG